jgi:hypothetical protein
VKGKGDDDKGAGNRILISIKKDTSEENFIAWNSMNK